MRALLLLLLFFVSGPALAGGACGNGSAVQLAQDIETATGVRAQEEWTLPAGRLAAEDLRRAVEELRRRGGTVATLFGMLADGQRRVLPGEVVRELLGDEPALSFLPLDALVEVVADEGELVFRFDFGRDHSRKLKLPSTRVAVLAGAGGDDPYRVGGGKVKWEKVKGRTVRVREEVHLRIGPQGILGLHKGDLSVRVGFFWIGLDLRSEHRPGRVDELDGKPVLQLGPDGEPLLRDGHYVPQRYDDWVVLTAAGREIWVGVPPLPEDSAGKP